MGELTLYNNDLDEDCYRVRLLISLLGIECRLRAVDAVPGLPPRDQTLLAIDSTAMLPALQLEAGSGQTTGDELLVGSTAIMVYLARRFDAAGIWLPDDPLAMATVMRRVDYAATALAPARRARTMALFGSGSDPSTFEAARQALRRLDDHLTRRQVDGAEFFVGNRATLAEVALFPCFALSRDYGLEHEEFPALRRWQRRVRSLPGFITMPGIPDYH